MAKSDLLLVIRDAYLDGAPFGADKAVDAFCAFAADWLSQQENRLVGVGMAAAGMTVRFADGREIPILTTDEPAAFNSAGPAVGISGSGGGVRSGGSLESASIPITGKRV